MESARMEDSHRKFLINTNQENGLTGNLVTKSAVQNITEEDEMPSVEEEGNNRAQNNLNIL